MLKIKIAIVLVLLLIVSGITYFSYRETMLYNQAVSHFQNQEFQQAREIFEKISDFNNAADFLMEMDYVDAMDAYQAGDLEVAYAQFNEFSSYKESSNYINLIEEQFAFIEDLEVALTNQDYRRTYALLLFNPNTDFLKWTPTNLANDPLFMQALKDVHESFYDVYDGYGFVFDNGKAEFLGTLKEVDYANTTLTNNLLVPTTKTITDDDISDWSEIVSIAVGYSHVVGLKNDGTVVARGSNKYGQLNVSNWTDIIKIAAGQSYTVGLKSDGTVVFTGYNFRNSIDVSTWSDINSIHAGPFTLTGIRNNQAVNLTGFLWDTNLVYFSPSPAKMAQANSSNYVAILANGSLRVVGSDTYGQRSIQDWNDMISVGVGGNYFIGRSSTSSAISRDVLTVQSLYVAGLSKDGKVLINGSLANKDTTQLVDIVSFKLGNQAIIGINKDGKLVSSDANNNELFATIDNLRRISE